MIDMGFSLTSDLTALLRAAAAVVAIFMVLATWVKTRAAVPIVAAVIVGGFVLWAVTADGLGWFSDRIGDDADRLAAAVVVEPTGATAGRSASGA